MESQHFTTDLHSPVYIHCIKTFYAYTGEIPSIRVCREIDYAAAMDYVAQHLAADIKKTHRKDISGGKGEKGVRCDNVLYVFHQPMLIDIEDNGVVCILYLPETETMALTIATAIAGLKKRRPAKQPTYNLIVTGRNGPYLKEIAIPKKLAAFAAHYNDDLVAQHPAIVACLKRKGESGLHLFHGQPGTGKSSYLRHLIKAVRGKEFIFLSPRLAANMDTPGQGRYIQSYPLHHSQEVVGEEDGGLRIRLRVVPTHELEMEILSFGAQAEVLAPASFRRRMREVVVAMCACYVTDVA